MCEYLKCECQVYLDGYSLCYSNCCFGLELISYHKSYFRIKAIYWSNIIIWDGVFYTKKYVLVEGV